MKCEICGNVYNELSKHVHFHKLTFNNYYDRYLKKEMMVFVKCVINLQNLEVY